VEEAAFVLAVGQKAKWDGDGKDEDHGGVGKGEGEGEGCVEGGCDMDFVLISREMVKAVNPNSKSGSCQAPH
jgi:hypothetical protein